MFVSQCFRYFCKRHWGFNYSKALDVIKEDLDSFTGENYNFNKSIQLNFNDSILKLFFYLLLSGRTRAPFGKSLCRSQALVLSHREKEHSSERSHVLIPNTLCDITLSSISAAHRGSIKQLSRKLPTKKVFLPRPNWENIPIRVICGWVQNCSLTLPSALANTKVLD